MTRDDYINALNDYVDHILQSNKDNDQMIARYYRSKKVELEDCRITINHSYTLLQAKTKKSRHNLRLWNRTNHRPERVMHCGCHDFNHRLKKKKPCKHLFRLIERYQTKTDHIRGYNNET